MVPEFVEEVPGVVRKIADAPEPLWAKALRDRPNEWAIIERIGFDRSKANSIQSRISKQYWRWMENYPGYWEAKYREYDNGFEIYARYVIE